MNEEKQPSYYAIIPSEVRYCEELKYPERLMYGEITALAGKEGYCFAKKIYLIPISKTNNTPMSRIAYTL